MRVIEGREGDEEMGIGFGFGEYGVLIGDWVLAAGLGLHRLLDDDGVVRGLMGRQIYTSWGATFLSKERSRGGRYS